MSRCSKCKNAKLINNVDVCIAYGKKINFKEKIICMQYKDKNSNEE